MFEVEMACDKKTLLRLAKEIRTALLACEKKDLFITLQDFPNGACGDASYILAKYLEENRCGQFDYVAGKRWPKFYSHAWLEQNGVIVDITADQFEGVNSEVIVTSDRSWHLQFEEDDRHVADFERFDENTVSNFRASYKQVLNKIET